MHRTIGTVLALLVASAAACSHASDSAVAADAGATDVALSTAEMQQVLARVGDRTITVGDYVAALQHMDQFDRIQYSAPARRRVLLDEMIDVMLLADEAREKGYDEDPATQEEVRQILRDALLAKAREGAPAPADIPAPEVQAYYDAHRNDFRDPERRRVSAIVLTSAAAAASALQAAQKPNAWGELVRARSVDPSAKHAGDDVPLDLAGDLGFVSPPGDARGVNARVPDEVRAAVFEIANVGEVLPRVVEAGGKFYVVKLESKSDARDRTLQDAERSIRVKLAQEKVRAAEEAMLGELRKQYPVQIDEAALSDVKVEPPRDGGAP